jgi:hypothetical protein
VCLRPVLSLAPAVLQPRASPPNSHGSLHITAFDEDMPTRDDSPVAIQGPITRACAHQLQYQVQSFLSSTPCQLQDRLLPKEILIVKSEGQAYEGLKNQQGGAQGCGQGAGPETGRAHHDGGLLGDGSESYSDSRTSAPSN